MMENQDFSITMTVKQPAPEVFKRLLNVRAWWTGIYEESIEGNSEKVGDEFTFLAGGGAHFTRQKLVQLVPDKIVVWLVTEASLNFVDKSDEWKGTKLSFEVSEQDGKTTIIFTHIGLVPQFECYNSCTSAWTKYLGERLSAALNQANGNPGKIAMQCVSVILALFWASHRRLKQCKINR